MLVIKMVKNIKWALLLSLIVVFGQLQFMHAQYSEKIEEVTTEHEKVVSEKDKVIKSKSDEVSTLKEDIKKVEKTVKSLEEEGKKMAEELAEKKDKIESLSYKKTTNTEISAKEDTSDKKEPAKKEVEEKEPKKKYSSKKKVEKKEPAKKKSVNTMTMEATGYTAYCSTGCIGVTATGVDVSSTIYHKGKRVIAVDPNVIPLHSVVRVSTGGGSYQAIAVDTGGDIKGNRIDILYSNKEAARNFGRRDVEVTILSRG